LVIYAIPVSQQIEVSLLTPNEWERLKQIRIRALTANPEAFGAKLTEVISQPKEDWLKLYEKEDYLIASSGGVDVGMLYIEVLKGDPGYRGIGVMRSLFNYIDNHSSEKGWQRQGLGVWADNLVAINSYKSLGFTFAGEKMLGDTSGKYFHHMVRDVPRD
jgi:ribosomal protein S18 acetylase RimI-like enzyme